MNPLLKLFSQNKDKGLSIRAEADDSGNNLYIYDVITSDDFWGGVTAEQVVKYFHEKSGNGSPDIHMYINSPGGDVFAARAMAQAIKDYKGQVIAHVDGMAASAATDLVMAADKSYISDGGMFMIHNAWTISVGDKDEFIKTASRLEKVDEGIARNYVEKSGNDLDQVIQWMNEETYFFGQEAIDAGFINELSGTSPKNKIDWDLSAYKNAPRIDDKPELQAEIIPETQNTPEPEPEKPDLSAHYRQLEVVQLTA